MKVKKSKGVLVVIIAILGVVTQSQGTQYCIDRKTPDRPNTGYCTIYLGQYACIPGGYTCDGVGPGTP